VVNDAASSRGCVAAECAIANSGVSTGTVYAAALVGRVIANRTINDVQGSRIEDPAADAPRVASERAADNGQDGGATIADATAEAGVTIPNGEARYGDGFACANLEGRVRGVAVNGQHVSSSAVDCDVLADDQFAGSECNHAGNTSGVNRVTIVRDRKRLTQRARTPIVSVRNYYDIRPSAKRGDAEYYQGSC